MTMTTKSSTWKLKAKFQYGGRLFLETRSMGLVISGPWFGMSQRNLVCIKVAYLASRLDKLRSWLFCIAGCWNYVLFANTDFVYLQLTIKSSSAYSNSQYSKNKLELHKISCWNLPNYEKGVKECFCQWTPTLEAENVVRTWRWRYSTYLGHRRSTQKHPVIRQAHLPQRQRAMRM